MGLAMQCAIASNKRLDSMMCHVQTAYLNTEGMHIEVHFLLESPHITGPDCLYRQSGVTVVCPQSAANALAQSMVWFKVNAHAALHALLQ